MAGIYIGDIGTIIEVQIMDNNNIPVNLTTVEDIWLVFTKPDKTQIIKKKTLGELTVTDAVNGKFTFTAGVGFWNISGPWNAYPIIKLIIGSSEYSGIPFQWNVFVGGT